jgi:hypothetical protein
MRRVRIRAKAGPPSRWRERYAVLPLDPRDPAVLHAKRLAAPAGHPPERPSRAA